MRGLVRAALAVVAFFFKLGLLLAVAGLVAALATWHTVDKSFRASVVTVPDVRGMTLDAASGVLASASLDVAVEARQPHETLEPGLVSYQDPLPGASTRKQRVVRVTLSAGQQLNVVPDLVGRSRREATIELKSHRLVLGQTLQVSSAGGADTILAHSPPAGAPLQDGARVDLLVSAGPRRRAFVMPDFTGAPVDSARELVTMAGLRVGAEQVLFDPGVPAGTVRAQEPPPGTRVLRDAAVNLTVSRGPEPPGSTGLPSRPGLQVLPAPLPLPPAPKGVLAPQPVTP